MLTYQTHPIIIQQRRRFKLERENDNCQEALLFHSHPFIAGANHLHALHIYKSLKGFMGPPVATQPPQSMINEEKKPPAPIADAIPEFVEVPSPQQKNGYDCGIYVIAIARAVCQWFSSTRNNNKDVDWISAVQRHVDASVEITMRDEIMKLIQELRDA
ncbi:unnamed protein product [Cuscuta europaea]|uniref:Ubiquitin-like protease family profile domain-containing protein n=1 Tax=Cuscuta europaea TaxID=41803 RepID=A0A9P0YRZ5_CUSEU|nr:unnamed protein product [Cuscuta europaea]